MVRVTEGTLPKYLETVNTDHSKSFVRGAFRRAAREMKTNLLKIGDVRKSPEPAINRVATSGPMVQAIAIW